jgi:subtilisin family serine protease
VFLPFSKVMAAGLLDDQVVVAVIDSGIELTHPAFVDHLWENTLERDGLPGVDDDQNGYIDDVYGYNFVDRNGDPSHRTINDHGTHVAGLVLDGARSGHGDYPVKIMPLNVFGTSVFSSPIEAMTEAIRYALRMGADVINISATSPGQSDEIELAIQEAASRGVPVVTAAGNEQMNLDQSQAFPASLSGRLPEVISVAAVDLQTGALCERSSFGVKTVWLAAPGCDRSAPKQGIRSARKGGIYGYKAGTSQAAPFVAGMVASWFHTLPAAQVHLPGVGLRARVWLRERVQRFPTLVGRVGSAGAIGNFTVQTQ